MLTPHLPLLLLQTSSALSHIFPEIRLDASKLVSLLLDHVPRHVTGSWPRTSAPAASSSKTTLDSGNNILEGLRLAVGLGGEAGQNAQMGKLGLAGRLTGLQTLLEFVKAALGGDDTRAAFDGWMEELASGEAGGRDKGKGREVVVSPDIVLVSGSLMGVGEWGVESDCWEIGRLGTGGPGDDQATNDVLVVRIDDVGEKKVELTG